MGGGLEGGKGTLTRGWEGDFDSRVGGRLEGGRRTRGWEGD